MPAYYELQRSTIIDHAGTAFDETLFSISSTRVEQEVRALFGAHGSFAEDALDVAWVRSLEHPANGLSRFFPPRLTVHGGEPWTSRLVPDMTVKRGEQELVVTVDPALLREATTRPRATSLRPFHAAERRFRDLETLGEATALLAPLRNAEGEVSVAFDLTGLIDSIPALGMPKLTEALRFVPFFEHDEFRDYWDEEASYLELGEIDAAEWDGFVPLETWFPLEPLETACMDVGVDFELVPAAR